MWLFTNFGFFSIVRKAEDGFLTIRARTRGDLDRLRNNYIRTLSPSTPHQGTDYPWRATCTAVELTKAMEKIVEELDYANFKDQVAITLGPDRSKRYGQVWSALYGMKEDLPEPPSQQWDQQPWPGTVAKGKKIAYGGIVLDPHGRFLLRKVRGGYDNYVWSFAKGRPDPQESPRATACREVREELGVDAHLISPLKGEYAGGTTINRYFLMFADPDTVRLDYQSDETDGLCWATPDEARDLVKLTTNATGKKRDLALIDDVTSLMGGSIPFQRKMALPHGWARRPLPARRDTLALDELFTDQEMARIWRGFVPMVQEERWFSFFEDQVLHMHRSWTGIEVFRFHFEPTETGWRIAKTEVSRHTDHYKPESLREELENARNLVRELLTLEDAPTTDGFVAAMSTALKPGYLGSPSVVGPLTHGLLVKLVQNKEGQASHQEVQDETLRLCNIFSGQDETFTIMPLWHTPEALGASLVQLADLNAEYCAGENLYFIVLEALSSVALTVSRIFKEARSRPEPFPKAELVACLSQLNDFIRDMFLGTTSVKFPGKTLASFTP